MKSIIIEDGLVVGITNPPITIGPFQVYPAETATIEPGLTIAAAEQVVYDLLHAFNIA